MIHSMTAFARESAATDQGVLTVELRSVNHRYLDCTFKLPDALRPLEQRLREQAGKALARGKLDCLIRLQVHPTLGGRAAGQPGTARQTAGRGQTDQRKTAGGATAQCTGHPAVSRVSAGPRSTRKKTCRPQPKPFFAGPSRTCVDNRRREGEKLAALVLDRLQQVESAVSATRQVLPALMQQQRDRIITRIGELDIEVDQGRLEQELVHLAQKADVDEELDRLEAHIGEVRHTLEKGGPCGRRLDFLMQELNREANTLSSKSIASSTTQSAVELKVLIEQMREQIQNIE